MIKLRASSSARNLACPASPILAGRVPNVSNETADLGTAAHEVVEMSLRTGFDAADFIGDVINTETGPVTVDVEMAEAAQMFVNYVHQYLEYEHVYMERKLLGDRFDMPQLGGTVDFSAYEDGHLVIVDYKHGVGVDVPAVDNKQLLTYALLAYEHLLKGAKVGRVTIVIVQPRSPGETIKVWETDNESLRTHKKQFEKLIQQIEFIEQELEHLPDYANLGDHCQFCNAKAICPAMQANAEKAADANFEVRTDLTDEQLAYWVGHEKHVRQFVDAVKREAKGRMQAGAKVPGYKLVESLSNRQWSATDDEIAAKLREAGVLKKQLHQPTKLLTPGAIEKLPVPRGFKTKKLFKEFVTSLTRRSVQGLAIAKESDKRPDAIASQEDLTELL